MQLQGAASVLLSQIGFAIWGLRWRNLSKLSHFEPRLIEHFTLHLLRAQDTHPH